MLDALFCRAFCLSTLFGLMLNGSGRGDDSPATASAASPEAESSALLVGAPIQRTRTEQTLLSGNDLPFLAVPEELPIVAENQQASHETLPERNSLPTGAKEDTFFVYSYLNYVTMSCVSALDDPDQFPGNLMSISSTQQTENATSATSDASPGMPKEKQEASQQSSTRVTSGHRPMTSIRLADSFVQLDESGQLLAKPEDSNPRNSTLAEHHYVPAPWHRSHASRNTYPIRYRPLYFEDPNMERCGETGGCLTEVKSIAHFAGRIPLLPYMMASDSPHKCVRALPDCPACQQFGPDAYLPKPTVKAIAVQAAATVGAIYVIP